jgi:signal transduction histidine kinase
VESSSAAPSPSPSGSSPSLADAYRLYVRQQALINTKVGCLLVVFLMPAGSLLDYFVYPQLLGWFFVLRMGASLAAAAIFASLFTEIGKRSVPWMGVVVPLIPVVSIAGMIAVQEGFASPYYAGLNLVLLAVGAVLHWTVRESVIACLLVIVIYVAAGLAHIGLFGGEPVDAKVLFNNFYFIALMDIIVVVGTYFAERQRSREFALRFELDANRAQLEENNQKLKELDELKGRFFANISHELRTPLTLMISPLETILTRYKTSLDPGAVDLLQTMQGNGLRLLKLINDLLDLVKLESGVLKVHREPVRLEPFIQGLASPARQLAAKQKVDLVVNVAPEIDAVMIDRDKFEKIVTNLQFNALKFTPSGGRVELKLTREGQDLVLRVSDTGIGIAAKDMPKMFSRFFQVDSSSQRKYQGVGIGLALVKELTELHGGTVGVDSVEGKGTTFTIRMPYLEADPALATAGRDLPGAGAGPVSGDAAGAENGVATPGSVSSAEWLSNLYHRANLFAGTAPDKTTAPRPAPAAQNGRHEYTALIADDQPDMLKFISSELAHHYNIVPVTDGQEAVEQAAICQPDVVLLDMMMPRKDGIQACREIRASPATQSVPVILITAHVDEETKLKALKAGASDFLPKPFSTTELHVRVRNLAEFYDYQRRLARQNVELETAIEKLKETESQLVQSEKLASLGRLSAGIIHEINNPLNFVTTGLFTLRGKARLIPDGERDDYAEILKDVEDGIIRVKSIVTDLRTFTHPGGVGGDEVLVADVVNSALRLLSQEWRDRVEVRLDLAPGQTILGEKNKLIQVLVNLLQNSLDAVAAKRYQGERPRIEIIGRVENEGQLSRLIVRDNGEGIDSAVLDKVFDPFFTTKDVGQGMGLGLSICYRIVRDFGGQISVRSERGVTTEFALEFPVKPAVLALQP